MMAALIIATLVVSTPQRDAHCDGFVACFANGKVYMQEYESIPAGTHSITIPADFHFPHFANDDHHAWARCGWALTDPEGMDVSANVAGIICHEMSHVAGNRH